MRKSLSFIAMVLMTLGVVASPLKVTGPDGRLAVTFDVDGGRPEYSVLYDAKVVLNQSPLGFDSNVGNFTVGMTVVSSDENVVNDSYTLDRSKVSKVTYNANELKVELKNAHDARMFIVFRVSNNDVAFRYEIPRQGETGSIRIFSEATGFKFPSFTTTFLTPQCDPMTGWKRTKPSYEEEYCFDGAMTDKSRYGHGYTFPALFHVGENGWVLVSETGVDRRYCGCRLSEMTGDGLYNIAFPMPDENNGNGTVEPAFALPGATPWRTLTVGADLKPIVETTAPWDNVVSRFEGSQDYKYGKGTWSWIVWQDNSINYDDQVKFVDLASELGYQYTLVDNWWDTNIGKSGIEKLVKYARGKNVELFLWYSSSGYWNDIEQGPTNLMDNPITRKEYMRWMHSIGIKGIKVDFFGGDKQETMRLYEDILSDANDYGLMVIFHGCTLPRGWERMYPNYVGSEAVLASENMFFDQHFCDEESRNTALHPFVRNTVGCMEFGGCFMSRNIHKGNNSGNKRRTTDGHELATTILFQNPIQNFAITPENLLPESEGGAPAVSIDFLKIVPTTWDETMFIDGYPGRYVVLARRHGNRWYIGATNATDEPLKLTVNLSMFGKGDVVTIINDDAKTREPFKKELKIKDPANVKITLQPSGGAVLY